MTSGVRRRRSPYIISYWKNGQLIYQNYLSRVSITASPLCTVVLDFFGRWRKPKESNSYLRRFSPTSVQETVNQLRGLTFLESWRGGTSALGRWKRGTDGHQRQASFISPPRICRIRWSVRPSRRTIRNLLRKHPQPPFFKHYPNAPVVPLPSMELPTNSEFVRVLLARRTRREFSSGKVPLQTLAHLLRLTWGVAQYRKVELLGRVPFED